MFAPSPCRFGGDQGLDGTLSELLFHVQAAARLIARAGVHATVDPSHPKPPGLEILHQVFERVAELGEDQQTLVGIVVETLRMQEVFEAGPFWLPPLLLDSLVPPAQPPPT